MFGKVEMTIKNLTIQFEHVSGTGEMPSKATLLIADEEHLINIDVDAIPFIRDFLKTISDQIW